MRLFAGLWGGLEQELALLRSRWLYWVLGVGFFTQSVLLITSLAILSGLSGDPWSGAFNGLLLSLASLAAGALYFVGLYATVHVTGRVARLFRRRTDTGQMTVLNLVGFVIFLIGLVALLPLLMDVISKGASIGGPMVAMILYSLPVILVLVGVASLLRYTERPF